MNDREILLAKIKRAKDAIDNLKDGPERKLWIRLHNKYTIALRNSAGAKLKTNTQK